jgi:hypothetical protein
MSVGPMGGFAAAVTGAPLAQTRGGELDRAAHETANQQRQVTNDAHAEAAAGIGVTDEDQAAGERDADGRRMWEQPPGSPEESADGVPLTNEPPAAKDPTGESGSLLDLTG